MEKVIKTYKGLVTNIDEINYTVEVTVSTKDIDRDNEIVDPSAFTKRLDAYRAHPILISSHVSNKTLQMQIGEALEINEIPNVGLRMLLKYYVNEGNAEADWAWKLVLRRIAAYSIGFMPYEKIDGSKEAGYSLKFTDIEMYELSQVLVPSNRQAIQDERKSEEMLIIKSFYGEEVDKLMKEEPIIGHLEEKDIEQVVGLAEMLSHLNYVKDWFVHSLVGEDTIGKINQAMALIMDCVKDQAKIGKKDFEIKSGRVLSEKTRTKLCEIHEKIHAATKEFKALLEDTQIPEELPPEDDSKKDLEIPIVKNSVLETLEEIKKNLGGK